MYLLDAADADVVILICNVMTTPADLMSFTQLDTGHWHTKHWHTGYWNTNTDTLDSDTLDSDTLDSETLNFETPDTDTLELDTLNTSDTDKDTRTFALRRRAGLAGGTLSALFFYIADQMVLF